MNPKLPRLEGQTIVARCPDCEGAISNFLVHVPSPVQVQGKHRYLDQEYLNTFYVLFRCSSCSRGGLAKTHGDDHWWAELESFYPTVVESAPIPSTVPEGVVKELRESELCASVGAWRAAAGLLRSTLEKALKASGYDTDKETDLYKRIEAAATDGVITSARSRKAHDLIRVLGNDVLHDPWREVKPEEVDAAHHYTQRIIEDLYDDRPNVEAILQAKKRSFTPIDREQQPTPDAKGK